MPAQHAREMFSTKSRKATEARRDHVVFLFFQKNLSTKNNKLLMPPTVTMTVTVHGQPELMAVTIRVSPTQGKANQKPLCPAHPTRRCCTQNEIR
jgi:hypothetical protein